MKKIQSYGSAENRQIRIFVLVKWNKTVTIGKRIAELKNTIPQHVTLVAVSKNQSCDRIMEAYHAGQRHFGENRVQELMSKKDHLPADILWHLIGHLQSNKVKFIAPFINLIHSVDSLSLLNEINHYGIRNNRVIDCMLEFHIAAEESKYGLNLEEAIRILSSDQFRLLQNIRVTGTMGMASFTEDEDLIFNEFKTLHDHFQTLKNQFFSLDPVFKDISMGMSGDYKIAIRAGSTMIRLGTTIFECKN